MQRKAILHDIVLQTASVAKPKIHFAYTIPDTNDMIRARRCRRSLYAPQLERGPGRHGISGALFIYFRDPDGHRIELFNTHYQHTIPNLPSVGILPIRNGPISGAAGTK
ncbi:hypothetical protein DMH17_17130 [Raoultella planticola]|nr:hypothetical protein [Raoultella planticola]